MHHELESSLRVRIFEAVSLKAVYEEMTIEKDFVNNTLSGAEQLVMSQLFFDNLRELKGTLEGLLDVEVQSYEIEAHPVQKVIITGYKHTFVFKFKFIPQD